MPRATPRVRDTTSTSDAPNSQYDHVGTPEDIPTMAFTTKYMNTRMPAHPNSGRQSTPFMRQMPFQSRASTRWLAPMVKQRNIMLP